MTDAKEDYSTAHLVELQRLGTSLASRTVKHSGASYEITDRKLTFFLRNIQVPASDGCWLWIGTKGRGGYGRFSMKDTSVGISWNTLAHRLSYQLFVGPIPCGLTLDHLCRRTSCVNPAHLDPCSAGENIARSPLTQASINRAKMTCQMGHPYDRLKTGGRYARRTCSICATENARQVAAKTGRCHGRCRDCGRVCGKVRALGAVQ